MILNGNKAKALIKQKGWTIKTLAAETDINYYNISQYLSGRLAIGEKRLAKIANALGVDIEELIHKDESQQVIQEIQVICPHCGKLITISVSVTK